MRSRSIPSGLVRTSAYRVLKLRLGKPLYFQRVQLSVGTLFRPAEPDDSGEVSALIFLKQSDILGIYICIGWGSVYKMIG